MINSLRMLTRLFAPKLNLHGINVLEEGRTFQDPALLSEIMELREEIEDARTAQAAENVAAKLEPYINQVSDEVRAWQQSCFAQSCVVKLTIMRELRSSKSLRRKTTTAWQTRRSSCST